MAADQRNYQVFTYVDDNGTTWNKRGLLDTAVNAIDGSTAATADTPLWTDAPSHSSRKAVFIDPTTQRTIRFTVYTSAAFAAITTSTTLARHVEGETATVTYSLAEKIPEKQRVGKTITNQRPEHA